VNEENELPEGWVQTTLGSVVAINPRVDVSALSDSTLVSFIPMAAVEARTGRIDSSAQRRLDEVRRGFTAFQEGDILFAKITPCMENGKSAVAQSLSSKIGFGSTEFHVLRPDEGIVPQLLYYYISQESFRQTARTYMTGSAGQLRVPAVFLADASYPLAPTNEQHRIVAAIEEQFTRLDAGVAALQRARTKLKRYRAAVLKAAVEGKLTEAWRAEHPTTEPASMLLERILKERRAKWEADLRAKGKDPAKVRYVEPAVPDVEGLSKLPEGWCWTTVEQVGNVQLGRQRAPQHHNGEFMRPYLRVANVFEARIDTSDILTMNFTPEEFETYRLKFGDILLNEGQSLELIGRSAIYRDEVPGACFQNTLVRFRAYPPLLPEYALTVFRVYLHTHRFQRIGKHTTNIAHLGAGRFAVLEFPVPPFTEQEQIVSEVERHLSLISQLETAVEANLKRAQRLRQGILHEAFAGRLVAQDSNDEPASVLLERIRSERGSERKNGTGVSKGNKGRTVKVPEPGVLDTRGTEQVELWENVEG
jgi:type I restriction enzyme S subunit